MLLYYLKCRKNTESKNPKLARTKNGRIMLSSKSAVCKIYQGTKPSGLISSLKITTIFK